MGDFNADGQTDLTIRQTGSRNPSRVTIRERHGGMSHTDEGASLRPRPKVGLDILILMSLLLSSCVQISDFRGSRLTNAVTPLAIPTYDGSGQVVEPDVTVFDVPWHGFRYWMAMSPYPFADQSKENPSVVASNDGVNWQVPEGLVNPLSLPLGLNYLSDASIFYDSESDQLWVFYNVTFGVKPVTGLGLNRFSSSDGVHWRNDRELFRTAPCEVTSPTVARVKDVYFLWSITLRDCDVLGRSTVTYRTSSDGINWSDPQPTTMTQPNYVVWHINVTYVPSKQEWWMAVAAYPSGQACCDSTSLFFSRSQDGIHWTSYSKPILIPSVSGWDDKTIYRSSFLFDAASNRLEVWYSGMNTQGAWHVGFSDEDYTSIVGWLGPQN